MWEFTSRVASSDRSCHTLRTLCGSGRVPEEPSALLPPDEAIQGGENKRRLSCTLGEAPSRKGKDEGRASRKALKQTSSPSLFCLFALLF